MILRAFNDPKRQEQVNIIRLYSNTEHTMELTVMGPDGKARPEGRLLSLSKDGLFLPNKVDPAFGFLQSKNGGLLVTRG